MDIAENQTRSFTFMMTGGIFHTLASDSVHFERCFSHISHLLPVLGAAGHIHIATWPLVMSREWTGGTLLGAIPTLGKGC